MYSSQIMSTPPLWNAVANVDMKSDVNTTPNSQHDEYVTLTYKLWEGSWRDDAVLSDREGVHGCRKYFRSAGPLTTPPTPQRTSFIFQAGTSTAGKTFATKHAECIFLPGMDPTTVRNSVDDINPRVAAQGRSPNALKTVAEIFNIVDETDEKALAKYEDYLPYVDLEGAATLFGGWTRTDLSQFSDDDDFRFTGPGRYRVLFLSSWSKTVPGTGGLKWTKTRVAQEVALGGPHARAIESASTVANILERWVEESGIDGFNLSYAVAPADFEDIVTFLVSELQRREVFWTEYAAATTRENFLNDGLGPRLRDDHPGSGFNWAAEDWSTVWGMDGAPYL
ncbi:luciferase-like domain-containing protein [Aspergillus stella-maris]|uniref:luciferase-like domain-containing protein n=1 Tax=Aspergillus stella-maris TaxID=1810926 RepID=UPI003CCD277D